MTNSNSRRGILLAGGSGSRLYPLTLAGNKQLLPVYDKPMIYYPLAVLMLAGIREILIITTPQDRPAFAALLGDGSQWGLDLHYAEQPQPDGIAQALCIGGDFLAGRPSALILGDNLFYGQGLPGLLARANAREQGATAFAYHVGDVRPYCAVSLDSSGKALMIEEKPQTAKAGFVLTGLYFFDGKAADLARTLKPSARGELEIADLNCLYLDRNELQVEPMSRGMAWLDTGTHEALLDAANYVRIIEQRQGLKVCCPEEIAWRSGFIDSAQLERLAAPLTSSGYGGYLLQLLGASTA